jgi:lipopolysaccharide export system ATP-binding protein
MRHHTSTTALAVSPNLAGKPHVMKTLHAVALALSLMVPAVGVQAKTSDRNQEMTIDAGSIVLDGKDITADPMYTRAKQGVGYLPQEPSVFRKLTVADNLRLVLELREDLDKAGREKELNSLLDELQINHVADQLGASLSGGERRRCEIARALAAKPRLILLDEPFAGVDPISVGEIQRIVTHLKQRGIGVLITDHNVRETLGICDRAYILNEGSVLAQGSPDAILENADVRRVYLGETFKL